MSLPTAADQAFKTLTDRIVVHARDLNRERIRMEGEFRTVGDERVIDEREPVDHLGKLQALFNHLAGTPLLIGNYEITDIDLELKHTSVGSYLIEAVVVRGLIRSKAGGSQMNYSSKSSQSST